MKIDISEIAGILKQEIRQYESKLDVVKVGRVLAVGDGIARIYGLPDAMAGEMLLFEDDTIGEVFNLEEDFIAVVLYGDDTKVREGSGVRSTGRLMSVPVGAEMIGRIVTPLGQPLDGGPAIAAEEWWNCANSPSSRLCPWAKRSSQSWPAHPACSMTSLSRQSPALRRTCCAGSTTPIRTSLRRSTRAAHLAMDWWLSSPTASTSTKPSLRKSG